ncbi:hypothetical protein [Arthrobacter sp. IK3]|uniref:hypothetical protein n=1 Tax=Arthrobacter sp. IK3 TaxID=3448169 RepID=UPI003EE2F77B
METIPYIGAHSAAQSPMGIILPLALAASILLLLSAYKPADDSARLARTAMKTLVIAAAASWAVIWAFLTAGYNSDSADAAGTAALNLSAAYGLAIDEEAALAIVQDDLEGYEFLGTTSEGVMILSAAWEENQLHLYSRGFEAAVLSQSGTER